MSERNQTQSRRVYLRDSGVTLGVKLEENDPLDELVHRLSQLPTSLSVLFKEASRATNIDPLSVTSHISDLLTATLMRPQMLQLEPTWRFLKDAQDIHDVRALLNPDRCLSAVAGFVTTTFLLDQMSRPIETTIYATEQRSMIPSKNWRVLFRNLKEKFRAYEPEFSCFPLVLALKASSTLKGQLEQFRRFEPKNDEELEQFIRTLYRLADFRHSQLYEYMSKSMEETQKNALEEMFTFLHPSQDSFKKLPQLYLEGRFDDVPNVHHHDLLMHVIFLLREEGTLTQYIERFFSKIEESEEQICMFWNYYTCMHMNPFPTDQQDLPPPQALFLTSMEKNPDRCGVFLSRTLKLPIDYEEVLHDPKLLKFLFVDLCAAKARGSFIVELIPIYRTMIECFSGGKNLVRATDVLEEKEAGAVLWTGFGVLVFFAREHKELSTLVQKQIKKGYILLTSFGVL